MQNNCVHNRNETKRTLSMAIGQTEVIGTGTGRVGGREGQGGPKEGTSLGNGER